MCQLSSVCKEAQKQQSFLYNDNTCLFIFRQTMAHSSSDNFESEEIQLDYEAMVDIQCTLYFAV